MFRGTSRLLFRGTSSVIGRVKPFLGIVTEAGGPEVTENSEPIDYEIRKDAETTDTDTEPENH